MGNEKRGYKIFKHDWTCSPTAEIVFQYKVGKTFEIDEKPIICKRGFHFCENLIDCFNYYDFYPEIKVAEVVALGEIATDGEKCCTNKIKILKELSWVEVLLKVNTGKNCNGIGNSGAFNNGNYNTGFKNNGVRNCGWNNIGDYNCGDENSGNFNCGSRNIGCDNCGNNNYGDGNVGDFNFTSFSNGCFNTYEQLIYTFNKPSNWTYNNWLNSLAYQLLDEMPAKEKRNEWWVLLEEEERNTIKNIPNFDAEIFKEITGIDVNEK